MKKQDTKTSPPVKVVGFRVEGATPSPRDTSLADAAAASTAAGSPSPVIIPPAFAGHGRSGGGDATPTLRPAATPPSAGSATFQLDDSDESSVCSLPPIRTEAQGLDPDAFARDRTPTKGQAVASPPAGIRALPLTPVGTSAPSDLGGQFAAAAATPLAGGAQFAGPTWPVCRRCSAAGFTRLCLDDNENARYSFRTPNPCLGGAEMWGEMFLSARPRTCKASQLEPVPNVWNRAGLSMNPSKQAPLKCPPAYTRAGPADKPLLKAFLSVYFTSSVFMAKTIDRYDNNMYCDDAFRSIDYSNIVGCIRKADAPKDKAMVVARGVITFRCYAPPVGAGLQTPLNTIGLTVRGMYTMQCKPKVAFKWSGPK
ncbi:expressed protein [Chlorella variabilis]|uniref:Expressed protein n=1 Tax=Chlorella variabilis TaxID=554065 RepID=E1ZP17_CHLVA|nr:expressed protein [Chlorella variabilis]EFN52436.1 expressed protein [Chlorella variabilis]|eukprot:XP_005844538.1 expressed protein [Chlorella variabilis]